MIELEPGAAVFWGHLQKVLADERSLEDFPGLVQRLDLKLTDPVDAVDPLQPEPRWRTDIKDGRGGFISSGRFGVGRDTSPQKRWFRSLELKLNVKSICISAQEVKRVYGSTRDFPAMPTDIRGPVTRQEIQDSVGYAYALVYPLGVKVQFTKSFTMALSNCAVGVSVSQYFEAI